MRIRVCCILSVLLCERSDEMHGQEKRRLSRLLKPSPLTRMQMQGSVGVVRCVCGATPDALTRMPLNPEWTKGNVDDGSSTVEQSEARGSAEQTTQWILRVEKSEARSCSRPQQSVWRANLERNTRRSPWDW